MTSAVLALLAGVGAAGTAAERGALWGKLNPYIECINSASPQVGHGARLYSGWVDVRKGPTGKEKVVNGVLALPASIVERCLRAMQAAEAKAPRRPELEQAGAAYAKALVEVQARTGEAYDYYHQGDYKDDRMARGKAMHPALMQAWERFHAADDGLRAL
ncbi:MAG TPA: DUF3829 domain-containing protein, partial [Vicinamibacteria bacterium]|nr:DUF3829 domain-containing protein [Vicinamibacteria bacterium]